MPAALLLFYRLELQATKLREDIAEVVIKTPIELLVIGGSAGSLEVILTIQARQKYLMPQKALEKMTVDFIVQTDKVGDFVNSLAGSAATRL